MKRSLMGLAATLVVLTTWGIVSAEPAGAVCLLPCTTGQQGGILDSLVPALLMTLVVSVVTGWLAFRAGVKRGADRGRTSDPGPDR